MKNCNNNARLSSKIDVKKSGIDRSLVFDIHFVNSMFHFATLASLGHIADASHYRYNGLYIYRDPPGSISRKSLKMVEKRLP